MTKAPPFKLRSTGLPPFMTNATITFAESSSFKSKEASDKVRRKENLCEEASTNDE
jgi:hypothetical protein